jgi:hypothetical protein
MTHSDDRLLSRARSGIYAAPAATMALREDALAHGYAWFDLDLAQVTGKDVLLDVCQKIFGLPSTFGRNWDALADSLHDLSWHAARGFVIMCSNGGKFAQQAPRDFALLMDVLDSACEFWGTQGQPFLVLLDAPTRGERKIQTLRS